LEKTLHGLHFLPEHCSAEKIALMHFLQNWLEAARLRTLPLALGVTGMGNVLVFKDLGFRWDIMCLSLLTTLLLQILSNFANDYGDSVHGADHKNRKGPQRAVQSGKIQPMHMKRAILIFALLSLVSGLSLLRLAFHDRLPDFLWLLALGLLCIGAAYFYTNGARPYGYLALGDIAVFLFFGPVAVLATAYLHGGTPPLALLMPALTMGFWSTAVLNLNNMRDMASDQEAGKQTIPLLIGLKKAKVYQATLVLGGGLALFLYGFGQKEAMVFGAIPAFIGMGITLVRTLRTRDNSALDAFLKPQALGTFLAVLGMVLFRIIF
jgi:1,4-dihydroxy-2-naphthoate polyprenyltransferase